MCSIHACEAVEHPLTFSQRARGQRGFNVFSQGFTLLPLLLEIGPHLICVAQVVPNDEIHVSELQGIETVNDGLRGCAAVETRDNGTQGNTRVTNTDRTVRIGSQRNLFAGVFAFDLQHHISPV
jgi:hypothetical protein